MWGWEKTIVHVVHVQAHKRTQKPQGTVNQKLYFYYRQIKHHFQRLNQKKNGLTLVIHQNNPPQQNYPWVKIPPLLITNIWLIRLNLAHAQNPLISPKINPQEHLRLQIKIIQYLNCRLNPSPKLSKTIHEFWSLKHISRDLLLSCLFSASVSYV